MLVLDTLTRKIYLLFENAYTLYNPFHVRLPDATWISGCHRVDEPLKGRYRDRYRAFRQGSVDKHRRMLYVPAHRRARSRCTIRGSRTNVCLSPAAISCDCGHTAACSEIGKKTERAVACTVTCVALLRSVTSATSIYSTTTRKKFVFDTGKQSTIVGREKKKYGWMIRVVSISSLITHMKYSFIFHSIKRYSERIVLVLKLKTREIQKSWNGPNMSIILR